MKPKHKPYIETRTSGGIKGLYRIIPKFNADTGELISETEHWLSDPVQVIGIGQSESEAFIVLQFTPEGQTKPMIEALPLADLGDKEGWKRLRQRGLKIANSATLRTYLADHLQLSGERTRWTNAEFSILCCFRWRRIGGEFQEQLLNKSQNGIIISLYSTRGDLCE